MQWNGLVLKFDFESGHQWEFKLRSMKRQTVYLQTPVLPHVLVQLVKEYRRWLDKRFYIIVAYNLIIQ